MTRGDVARLLALIQAFDRRTIGETDVEAWTLVIADLDQADCAEAIRQHFTESREWIMPSDVRGRAKILARTRRAAEARLELEAPPLDREVVAARYAELQAEVRKRGHKPPEVKSVPHEDYRSEDARRREAQAEVEQLRHDQGESEAS